MGSEQLTGGSMRPGTTSTRRLRTALLLSAAMSCAAIAGPVHAQNYSFSTIDIQGNERVEDSTILTYAGIAPGQAVSAGGLNDAYQRILASGLFETVELKPSGGRLVIAVQEYPTINVVAFEGNKQLKDEALATIVKSQSRRVYSPAQAEADAAQIAAVYANTGRLAARVDPKIIRRSDNRVDLVFEIQEGKITEIQRLSFTGNRVFSDRRLREILQTKQAGLLHQVFSNDSYVAERIDLDKQLLTDFYNSRGFIDFKVLGVASEFSRERDGFFLTFNVYEGPRFSFGKISTVSQLEGVDAAEFQRAIRIRKGVTYSPNAVDLQITRMEQLALDKGLDFVRVEPRVTRNDRDQTLDVEFVISRGPRQFVERIDIEGNATTLDRVIRRQFQSVEGDPFNPREIRNAAARIRALGFFSKSTVEATPGSAPDQMVVDVNVTEQPTGSLSFGLSYAVSQGIGAAINFSETNFLGRGQYLGLSINTTADSKGSSLTFAEPAFLDRDLRFKFSAYYSTYTKDNAYYNLKLIGLVPSVEFPVSEYGRISVGFRVSSEELSDVDADRSSVIIVEEEGKLDSTALTYGYIWDTRGKGLDPNVSMRLEFNQELIGAFGGDVEAVLTTGYASYESKIRNEEMTFRAALEGGLLHMLDSNSRVTDRFFGEQIRGFEYKGIGPRDLNVRNEDALGGNAYAVARVETDFPIGVPEEYGMRGGLFLDVGSVWSLDNTDGGYDGNDGKDIVDDSAKIRAAIGFSVFWTTAIGPLRFNFSHALAKEKYDEVQNFDLTVSTRF